MHRRALHPYPAAMDQPHFPKTGGVRFVEVFLDDRGNVARLEGVEVEFPLDRDTDGVVLHGSGFRFVHGRYRR